MTPQPQRCAIVGTAETWVMTPWADPTLRIVSLNDAYALGLKRVDEWYELHPFAKMVFRPAGQKIVDPRTIPPGHYVRPEGHLQWLQRLATTNPVWTQDVPPQEWGPNAQRLPIEDLEARFGSYWASGPAYILMHLYARGFREFQIYGIHLATAAEYRDQRPNFEALIGRVLGPSVEETRTDGRRVYRGADCTVVLPEASPILQHGWRYAYDAKPVAPRNPYADELKATQQAIAQLTQALITWPIKTDKTQALERLARLRVIELDCQHQLAKAQRSGTLVAQVAA